MPDTDPERILIIDHNADNSVLLARTLLRKFPRTMVQQCRHEESAMGDIKKGKFAAIVVHRTHEMDAPQLIKLIRAVAPDVPILAVSGIDRSEHVLAAGATGFLKNEEWLTIGTVVSTILALRGTQVPQQQKNGRLG